MSVLLSQLSGLGRIRPNVIVLGYKEDWRKCDMKVHHRAARIRTHSLTPLYV